jgi:hypothetical protein
MVSLDSIVFDLTILDTTRVTGYSGRLNMLVGSKIVPPTQLIFYDENLRKIYVESVRAYLYGMPNASIPMILRFFQISMRNRFRQVNNDFQANPKIEDLINWVEKTLNQKTTAHGFQILRNFVHTEDIVEDQDALEAIRHISLIVNKVIPYQVTLINQFCNPCLTEHSYSFKKDEYYIGNNLVVACPKYTLRKMYFKANI